MFFILRGDTSNKQVNTLAAVEQKKKSYTENPAERKGEEVPGWGRLLFYTGGQRAKEGDE